MDSLSENIAFTNLPIVFQSHIGEMSEEVFACSISVFIVFIACIVESYRRYE